MAHFARQELSDVLWYLYRAGFMIDSPINWGQGGIYLAHQSMADHGQYATANNKIITATPKETPTQSIQ
jgi:hypothetical protein